MSVTIRWAITKRCPYVSELDAGHLVITFPGDAPELHNLAEQVHKIAEEPVSHEDFTRAVEELVPGAQVTTTWHTGPWSVEVREGEV